MADDYVRTFQRCINNDMYKLSAIISALLGDPTLKKINTSTNSSKI